jgi:hypothetical protein
MQTIISKTMSRNRRVALASLLVAFTPLYAWNRTSDADELALVADVVVEGDVVMVEGLQQQQFRAQFEPLLKVELSAAQEIDRQERCVVGRVCCRLC